MRRRLLPVTLLSVTSLVLLACGEGEVSQTDTVVSYSSVNQRFSLLERRFTADQLCEDFRTLGLIMRDIHFEGPAQDILKEQCPSSYRAFAESVQKVIRETRDLHTTVSFGYGLDASSYPVVRSCLPADACTDLIGTQMMALPSRSTQKFYAIATDVRQKGHIFEIKSLGTETLVKQLADFRSQFKIPNAAETFPYFFPDYLLKRESLDSRSKADVKAELWDIHSKTPVTMTLSYDDRQSIVPSAVVDFMSRNVEFARTYGCQETAPDAQEIMGACVTEHGKGIFWLSEWPQLEDGFAQALREQLTWLNAQTDGTLPLIFDVSGNQGGSPLAVAQFMCSVGDDLTLKSMLDYQLITRPWPQSFELPSRSLALSDLQILVNGDLIFRDSDWTSRSDAAASTRQRLTGFLERAHLTAESCKSMRLPGFAGRKWLVTTNGQEFSATEDFLFLASQGHGRFTSMGSRSAGGVGAPSWVVLPQTRTRVRISPTRMQYAGKMVTEKLGLPPHITVNVAEPENVFLQKSLHALETDGIFNPTLDPTNPLLLRILPLFPASFAAVSYVGNWKSSCLPANRSGSRAKSEMVMMSLNLAALTAIRKEYSDANCVMELAKTQADVVQPLPLIQSIGSRSLLIPATRLVPLALDPRTPIELTRTIDGAPLYLCTDAKFCPKSGIGDSA